MTCVLGSTKQVTLSLTVAASVFRRLICRSRLASTKKHKQSLLLHLVRLGHKKLCNETRTRFAQLDTYHLHPGLTNMKNKTQLVTDDIFVEHTYTTVERWKLMVK